MLTYDQKTELYNISAVILHCAVNSLPSIAMPIEDRIRLWSIASKASTDLFSARIEQISYHFGKGPFHAT